MAFGITDADEEWYDRRDHLPGQAESESCLLDGENWRWVVCRLQCEGSSDEACNLLGTGREWRQEAARFLGVGSLSQCAGLW